MTTDPALRNPYSAMDLQPGNHICCLFETEEEHRAVLTPFLRQGLERGEKVLYIVDAHTAEVILGYLQDEGVDVEACLERGQFAILSIAEGLPTEAGSGLGQRPSPITV